MSELPAYRGKCRQVAEVDEKTVGLGPVTRCARCTACGHKGATLQHPGWGGSDIGFLPFPVHLLAYDKPR
jgi:hypothetical protein